MAKKKETTKKALSSEKGGVKTPKHKLYTVAESLFIDQGMTCNEIAEQLDITEATLSKWRNTMEWDQRREDVLSSPDKIRTLLREELKSIAAGNKAKMDTDALSKVSKALQYFDGKVGLAIVISVFKEFDTWMTGVDPAMAIKFTEYHRIFIHERAQQDSLK
ncbi:MAG: transposase [Marinifilaceae bacterium]